MFGISEWRSLNDDAVTRGRTILALPFLWDECDDESAPLIPGSSKTFPLQAESPTGLLDEAREKHCSIVGGVLVKEETALPVFPLLEICNYSSSQSGSASVTLKCVRRARMLKLRQVRADFLEGECTELQDEDSHSQSQSSLGLEKCNELVQDIEKLLATRAALNAAYQQAFWKALPALGYNPTALLTRDPSASNSQKEIEAASWAGLACLEDPEQQYNSFAAESALQRLQIIRRAILAETFDIIPTGTPIIPDIEDDGGSFQ